MYYYRINKFCIKLIIETTLHYDARSEKHQSNFIVFASKHFTFPYKYTVIDFIYYFH
jgi:hypothetical protein